MSPVWCWSYRPFAIIVPTNCTWKITFLIVRWIWSPFLYCPLTIKAWSRICQLFHISHTHSPVSFVLAESAWEHRRSQGVQWGRALLNFRHIVSFWALRGGVPTKHCCPPKVKISPPPIFGRLRCCIGSRADSVKSTSPKMTRRVVVSIFATNSALLVWKSLCLLQTTR